MIWADRLGIVWVCVVLAVVMAIDPTMRDTSGTVVFWVSAVPWLGLRALDWIFSGEFRRGHRAG